MEPTHAPETADIPDLSEEERQDTVLDLSEEEIAQLLTTEELMQSLNVCRKTIARWRAQVSNHLRHVIIKRKNGCRTVGFRPKDVEEFIRENGGKVRYASAFNQLTEEKRQDIINEAECLAREGWNMAEITKTLAHRTGRDLETIRYILKIFIKENPHSRIAFLNGPLTEDPIRYQKLRRLFEQHEPIDKIAKTLHETKTAIRNALVTILREDLDGKCNYVDSPEFHDIWNAQSFREHQRREEEILGPMPDSEDAKPHKARLQNGLPPYLAALYETPLLTREQECHLFRKMNYLKFKAARLAEANKRGEASLKKLGKAHRYMHEASYVKNEILRANLRLVVSIAKRHVSPQNTLFELVSDGNISLIRAAEKFDYTRGFKFSTYASWAIMKNFARTIPSEFRHLERFATGMDDHILDEASDARSDADALEQQQDLRRSLIARLIKRLTEREQDVIKARFGLGEKAESQTLQQLGAQQGVTKECIRQIEFRALQKLRRMLVNERLTPSTLGI